MNFTHLSKTLARALRQEPELYGLRLDGNGWAPLEHVVASLRRADAALRELTVEDIERLIAENEKARFEIAADRIRAVHGQVTTERITREAMDPPMILYHGTTAEAALVIRKEGLKGMDRRYVHMSPDVGAAVRVGKRRTPKPVVLRIRALEAHCIGVRFYKAEKEIWLADEVPAEFIDA